jgi:hypothetical protein
MKFSPMNRLTLSALLAGLQGGMSGQDAYAVFQGVMQNQQAMRDARQQRMMDAMGNLQSIAQNYASPQQGQAYLQSLVDSHIIGGGMADRLTAANNAFYPGGSSVFASQGSSAIPGVDENQLSMYGVSADDVLTGSFDKLNSSAEEIYYSWRDGPTLQLKRLAMGNPQLAIATINAIKRAYSGTDASTLFPKTPQITPTPTVFQGANGSYPTDIRSTLGGGWRGFGGSSYNGAWGTR